MATTPKDDKAVEESLKFQVGLDPLQNIARGIHSIAGALWSLAESFRGIDGSLDLLASKDDEIDDDGT